jgi:hypothetical protein
MFRLG